MNIDARANIQDKVAADYSARYDELDSLNREWLKENPPLYDPRLVRGIGVDTRRCMALVAATENVGLGPAAFEPAWWNLIGALSKTGLPFVYPNFHHKFMITSPWTEDGVHADIEVKRVAMAGILPTIAPYHIYFNRVIPVSDGLILAGIPSRCLDADRNLLRAAGLCGEPTAGSVAVAVSILHWTAPVSVEDIETMLHNIIDTIPKGTIFARMAVNKLEHIEGSWLM